MAKSTADRSTRGRARRSRRTSPTASRTCTRPSTTRSSRSPTARATRCRGRPRAAPASRARASRRRSPRRSPPSSAGRAAQEYGVKNLEVRIKGPGPGRESAVRALNALGLKITQHRGRDAGPAQRLPPAEEAPRLRQRQDTMASYLGREVPLMPPRRHEPVPEEREVLHRQVRDRAPQLSAGPARPEAQHAPVRLRPAAAREAEAAPHVRRARAPVPQLLTHEADAPQGHHRREPAAAARERAWTTSSTAWASAPRAPKRASSCATRRSSVNGKRVNIPSYQVQGRATSIAVRDKAQEAAAHQGRRRSRRAARLPGLGRSRRQGAQGHVQVAARARRICRDINESLVVELYSK